MTNWFFSINLYHLHIIIIQSINFTESLNPCRSPLDSSQWNGSHVRSEGHFKLPSIYDHEWALDTDDDEPVDETSSDDVDHESTTSNINFLRPYPTERVDDRDIELVAAVEDIDQEAQNTTFAAAIRWALRTRNLDVVNIGGNEVTGGVAEEMDETDDTDRLDMIGDRVNHNILRARELVAGTDRRIRLAETQLRRVSEIENVLGVGAVPRAGSGPDRKGAKRDKGGSEERHPIEKQRYTTHPVLLVGTVLEPDKHPKDFIAVVIVDAVLNLVTSVLDDFALDCYQSCQPLRGMGSEAKRVSCTANPLQELALNIVKTILKSSYRALLVPGVFRTLLAHCGLRVKWAVADALKR